MSTAAAQAVLSPPPSREMKESVLVGLAKAGHIEAFEELMAKAYPGCLRVATSVLGNREDAEDEVQSAFWKAHTHLLTFAEESKFSTWVCRIVINHCMVRLREERRRKNVRLDDIIEPSNLESMSQARAPGGPENEMGKSEVERVVRQELDRIPRILRTPLELRHFHGYQLCQIAAHLGISNGAAKSRLIRGHKFLKERMQRHIGLRGPATLTF